MKKLSPENKIKYENYLEAFLNNVVEDVCGWSISYNETADTYSITFIYTHSLCMSDFIKLDKAFSKRNTFTVFPGEDSFEFSVSVNDIDFLKPEFELNYFSKSAIDEETRNNWIKSCLKELRTDDVKECPFYYRTSGDSFVLVCKFEDEPIEIYDFLIRRKGIV